MKKNRLFVAAFFSALAVAGLVLASEWDTTLGVGTDLAAEAKCLSCHVTIKDKWDHASTHALILDCTNCHVAAAASGPGHASARPCADCHSERTHPAADTGCLVCHDPHGSANAFLVKDTVAGKKVFLSRPEGRSQSGLARGDGTGVCEVCHTGTTYYDSSGTGGAHDAAWCIGCHSHQNGFSPEPGGD
jgi:predicted CXXCH cytochrome family protein